MDIVDFAKQVVLQEKRGVEALMLAFEEDHFQQQFIKMVTLIRALKGRLIITGIGKSGHIGKKMAATLSSLGTPAFFVHAAEANHGDLGMVTKDDAILALSWSGNTAELRGMIAYAHGQQIPLLAMTVGKQSFLAQKADVVLLLPSIEEACPNGLAPTTSTLIQLVLGDVLATTLAKSRAFTTQEFYQFHPGGALGAKLTTLAEIMHQGNGIPLVQEGSSVVEATHILAEKHFGCVAVVNAQGELCGIFTDGDLARHLHLDLQHMKVEDVMTQTPKTLPPETYLPQALALMKTHKIAAILVVKDKKPLGIIHIHDILRLMKD